MRTLSLAEFADVRPLFAELLTFRQPEAVQKAALETLARFEQPGVAAEIVTAWPSFSPQVRASAKNAARSFGTALADTFRELGDEVDKAINKKTPPG